MIDYTTPELVAEYLGRPLTTAESARIGRVIKAISRNMDRIANRTLVAADPEAEDYEPEIRYYDGPGIGRLRIDDARSISEIAITDDGVTFNAITDAAQYPRTAPMSVLQRSSGAFPYGTQNVRVTGNFGYFSTLPDDLQFAATVLVAGVLNGLANTGKSKKSESIGEYSVTYNDDAQSSDFDMSMDTIRSYRLIIFG